MKSAAFLLAPMMLLCAAVNAQIPRTLSYQAVLTDTTGNPKPDGPYVVTFRLYASAGGGGALWSETQTLKAKRGLLNAVLGSVTPIGSAVTFDRPYWLSLQVVPDAEITTRLPLASVGYSFSAGMADSARYAKGTVAPAPLALSAAVSNPHYVLSSTATGTGGGIVGISDSGFGIVGQALGTTGVNYGVAGNSSSPDGIATSGVNLAATGWAVGVQGSTLSTNGCGVDGTGGVNGYGVVGRSWGTSGTNYGVVGNSSSPDGIAVTGWNLATTGNAVGVRGSTNSPTGWGVYGSATANGVGIMGQAVGTSGVNYGVAANSSSPDGFAVFGTNVATTGDAVGIRGHTNSPTGWGVYGSTNGGGYGVVGQSLGTSGVTIGVVGNSKSPDGFGVSGWNLSTIGTAVGIRGLTNSPTGWGVFGIGNVVGGIGVRGEAFLGVVGKTQSTAGAGVWGEYAGTTAAGYGVLGISRSPKAAGVYGVNTDTSGWAGYFEGKVGAQRFFIIGGADLAEPFDTEADDVVEPGTLMVIDPMHPGKLMRSELPYDVRVAGIVSGAGGIKPGITLQQDGLLGGKTFVALAGRVYCLAEAETAPIQPGDFLTSSGRPGHAMKAVDNDRFHGAIIGKAMSSLDHGSGLVLVLVNLQ